MAAARHIIHKQHLDLSFRGGTEDMGIHATLTSWIYGRLLPAMEEVFNEFAPAGKHIRLQSLELDAGDISGPDWEEELVMAICVKLRKELSSSTVMPQSYHRESLSGRSGFSISPREVESYGAAGGSLTVYSENEQLNLLMQYLQSGSVPWYAAGLHATELLHWLEETIQKQYFTSAAGIRFLSGKPEALRRLLMQSRILTLDHWFQTWDETRFQEWLPSFLLLARHFLGHGHTAMVWSYALLFAGITGNRQAASDLLLQLREGYPGGLRMEGGRLTSVTLQLFAGEITIGVWTDEANKLKNASSGKRNEHMKDDGAGSPNSRDAGAILPANENKGDHNPEYFIGNAGIVLLHPFLLAWFTALQLYSETGWVSDDAHRRAVLILHYAATGMTEVAEFELPLCKLITGYPMDRPVEARLELSTDEIEETKALLTHVIAQWPILKTTSPEGLQQSFLMREGKLTRKDNGWLLQVAQKSYDLLLDHLPWSIGAIKNSWMPEILFTEWV